MKIIGVGAAPGLLTREAIIVIESAGVIYGSKRAIELAKEHIKCEAKILADYDLQSLPEKSVILSTGDPMLSGLGKFAKSTDEIITGISSFQLACSRLHLEIDETAVISAHSKEIEKVKERLLVEIRNGRNVFLLPGPSFGVRDVAEYIKNEGFSKKIYICEELGYPGERIIAGTMDKPPIAQSDMYCVVINDSLVNG